MIESPTKQTKPRISIITPSYNQGNFIEETIRSIISQKYENFEYFIIDGGSTDNTLEIIRKYESHIAYWVSEPDHGQTHAINKGLARATGDIIAYINSDDYYLPETFHKVADYFHKNPETDLLHGRCRYVDINGNKIGEHFGDIETFEEILDLWNVWWNRRQFVQPEVFWSRRLFEKVGFFNESLHYVMDYEYWLRALRVGGVVKKINREISAFRFTPDQKSNHSEKVADELLKVIEPIIWDKNEDIAYWNRLKLKGKWLYDNLFLKTVDLSLQRGEGTVIRQLSLLKLIVAYPQLLASPFIYRRINSSLKGKIGFNNRTV